MLNSLLNSPFEPVHEISNNEVCATSKASDQPAHTRSLIRAFASRLSIHWLLSYWLNTILEFLSLKGGCRGSFESTHVEMPHCLKYHALAHLSANLRDLRLVLIISAFASLINVKSFYPVFRFGDSIIDFFVRKQRDSNYERRINPPRWIWTNLVESYKFMEIFSKADPMAMKCWHLFFNSHLTENAHNKAKHNLSGLCPSSLACIYKGSFNGDTCPFNVFLNRWFLFACPSVCSFFHPSFVWSITQKR